MLVYTIHIDGYHLCRLYSTLSSYPSFLAPLGFEVTPSDFQVTPLSFEVTPSGFEVTPLGLEVTPLGFQVKGSNKQPQRHRGSHILGPISVPSMPCVRLRLTPTPPPLDLPAGGSLWCRCRQGCVSSGRASAE